MPAFKDSVNAVSVAALAARLSAAGTFPAAAFKRDATRGLQALELKARISHVVAALVTHMPSDFRKAAAQMREAVAGSNLGMWEAWPAVDWVAVAGLRQPKVALPLLADLTANASAEMAIRPFINADIDGTLKVLQRWTAHDSEHVRRLVSEGSRPRLPWAPRIAALEAEPARTVPLLDALREDGSAYVRRSVANHLNDLNKVDHVLALKVARRWHKEGGQHSAAVLRHGLRTLIKAGDTQALALIGAKPLRVTLEEFVITTPKVRLGESLEFSFTLHNEESKPGRAVIDYVVHHQKASGGTSPKVFKLSTRTLPPGQPVTITRAHPMRPITTRRYYPGEHRLELQVNGAILAASTFHLTVK